MLQQIDAMAEADKTTDLIAGFDMSNEEDYCPPIDDYLELLYTVKIKYGNKFQFYLSAGQNYSRANTNLHDAILLGAKRIGHGLGLAQHPNLIEMVKENDICIEACPISNKVLGYVHDLRLHPARALMRNGVKVSISSAYPGFFNNYGVTLDYLIAYLEWDLDLSDMR